MRMRNIAHKKFIVSIIIAVVLLVTIIIVVINVTSNNSIQEVDTHVLEYIESTVCLSASTSERTTFCAAKMIGDDRNHLYLYVYKADYFYEGQSISRVGVEMFPLALEVEYSGNYVDIIGYSMPSEGAQYGLSMRKIFPDSIIKQISLLTQEDFSHLESLADERAQLMMD